MTWTNKYWDILNHFYWWPPYIGLRSISQKKWTKQDGKVCVPAELVNMAGPLYCREQKFEDLENHLLGNEEILNHIFDLTFSIAPDFVINESFLKPLGYDDEGSFQSIGREVNDRYSWNGNVTQQDGFFVSDNSAIAVELKLKSSSWPEQVLKYSALLAWEELHKGSRENLGLLFIVPAYSIDNHWKKCGLNGPTIDRSFLDTKWKKKLPDEISNLIENNFEQVASVLDRLKINVISWSDLRNSLLEIHSTLDLSHRGDQTLSRLLSGFLAQLDAHRDTGLSLPNHSINADGK